jgi:hypothetical protein
MRWFRRGDSRPPDPEFLDVLDEYGLAAYERQAAFEQRIGERDWELDQDAGVLRLGDDIELAAQILGSEVPRHKSWLWAWANESVDPRLTAKAREARSIGEDRGLSFLAEPQIDTERTGDGYLLALATTGLLRADAYYPCPYPGGLAYVLVDLAFDAPDLGPPTARRVVEVVSMAIHDGPRLVTRRSLERYLARFGGTVHTSDDSITFDDDATFRFDDLGRLTAIEATIESDS